MKEICFYTCVVALSTYIKTELIKIYMVLQIYFFSFLQDAQYYLKTHFQHLNQADNKTENSSSAKLGYIIKPSAPQAETKTEVKRTPEYSNTSRTVDQGLRDKHERRRQKEKERAKRLDDSDNEQAYGTERQKIRTKTEDRKYEQRDYKTETRQVTGQNVDDLNNNCSEPQNYW